MSRQTCGLRMYCQDRLTMFPCVDDHWCGDPTLTLRKMRSRARSIWAPQSSRAKVQAMMSTPTPRNESAPPTMKPMRATMNQSSPIGKLVSMNRLSLRIRHDRTPGRFRRVLQIRLGSSIAPCTLSFLTSKGNFNSDSSWPFGLVVERSGRLMLVFRIRNGLRVRDITTCRPRCGRRPA